MVDISQKWKSTADKHICYLDREEDASGKDIAKIKAAEKKALENGKEIHKKALGLMTLKLERAYREYSDKITTCCDFHLKDISKQLDIYHSSRKKLQDTAAVFAIINSNASHDLKVVSQKNAIDDSLKRVSHEAVNMFLDSFVSWFSPQQLEGHREGYLGEIASMLNVDKETVLDASVHEGEPLDK